MGTRKTNAGYIQELAESNPLFASGAFFLESQYENATTKIKCRCSRCGNAFERRPDHLKKQGCPKCDGNDKGPNRMDHKRFLEKLEMKNRRYAGKDFEVVGEYQGALKHIACRCPKHGKWETTPSSLLNGSGCPKCANRMTDSEFFARLSKQNDQFINGDIEILGSFTDRKTRIRTHCLVCDHSWDAQPADLLANHGCPNFRRHPGWVDAKAKDPESFLSELAAKHPDIKLLSPYEKMTQPLRVRCAICNHEWTTTGTRLLAVGQGCSNWRNHPGYKSPTRKSHAEFVEELVRGNRHYANGEFEILSKYDGVDNHIECHCLVCGNRWSRTAYDLVHNGSDCPECSAKRRGLASRKTHEQFLEELARDNEYYATRKFEVTGEYESSKTPIACRCLVCDNNWKAKPEALLLRGAGCPRCSRSGTSRVEQILSVALEKSLGEEAVLNRDKTAIGSELDIYVPVHHLAIEYGSWFWHKNRFEKDLEKARRCRDAGIRLLMVYDQCREPFEIYSEDVRVYPFDLWSEKGQPALKKLVADVLSMVESDLSFSEREWKSLRAKASSRTVLKSEEEFKAELAESNPHYAEGQFEVIGEYTGVQNKVDCRCNVCGYEWAPTAITLPNSKGCPRCANEIKKTHDEVVAEIAALSPDVEVLGEYEGASKPLMVKCKICGHEWKTTTGSIRQGKGCPKYRRHPGFIDPTARTQERFVEEVAEANPSIEPLGEYKNANTKVEFRCKVCGYGWSTKPAVIINLGGGCPKCAGLVKPTQDEFLEKLVEKNQDYANGKFIVVGKYVNSKTKIECRCHEHGAWATTPNLLLRGTGCPKCGVAKSHATQKGTKRKSAHSQLRTHEQFISELKEKNVHYANGEFEVVGVYAKSTEPIVCLCPMHGQWATTPSNLIHHASQCPKCRIGEKRITHGEFLERLAKKNRHYANGEFVVVGEYTRSKDDIECECPEHGRWQTKANTLMNGAGCPKCSSAERGKSRCKTQEQFLEDLSRANKRYANGDFVVVGSYADSRLPIECECPKHGSWQASYKALMYGSGCPRCVSLASINPGLAAEWHPTLNGDLTPWDVKPGSSKLAWWRCSKGHEWQQRIDRRHHGRSKCPLCRKGR